MKRNLNLLLINPWIYDFTAYDFWSKPLGLLYIASILREQKYLVNYIDCMDRYNPKILKLQQREFPKKDEFGRGAFYKKEIKKPEILKDIPRRFSRYGITEGIFLEELEKAPQPQSNLDYICILSSRGCPFRCSYCASFRINPKLEFRNPAKVVKEMTYWNKEKRVKDFVFYDDALLINPKDNFLVMLDGLIYKKVNAQLHTPNGIHARMINEEIASKMYQAGVETIRLGFETVDSLTQSETGGKITNPEFKKAVDCLLRAGFKTSQIGAYLLIGLPGQDIKQIIDSIRFVIDCGVHPHLAKFSAIPGTKIWDRAKSYFKLEENVDPLFHNDALLPYLSPDITDENYQQIKSIVDYNSINSNML